MRTRLKSYLRATTVVDVLPMKSIISPAIPLRQDLGDIRELALSIKQKGLLEPIIVRPAGSKFQIVAGHRRYTACRLNGFSEIQAIVLELDDREAFEVSIEENLHRRTLDPIEEGIAFKLYVERFGWGGVTELARSIGKSEEYVSHRMGLLSLPEQVQQVVRRRLLSSSDAWEISRVRTSEAQVRLASAALTNGMTVRQLRRAANLLNEGTNFDTAVAPEPSPMGGENRKRERVRRAGSSIVRVALIRIDNLIEAIDGDEPLSTELMALRRGIHELIDAYVSVPRTHDERSLEESVKAFILEKYLHAFNRRSIAEMSSIRSENFSMFDDFPPLTVMGLRDSNTHDESIFRTISDSRSRIDDIAVTVVGDAAVVTCIFHYDMRISSHPYRWDSRVTFVVERDGNGWRVAHEHWSQANPKEASFDKVGRLNAITANT